MKDTACRGVNRILLRGIQGLAGNYTSTRMRERHHCLLALGVKAQRELRSCLVCLCVTSYLGRYPREEASNDGYLMHQWPWYRMAFISKKACFLKLSYSKVREFLRTLAEVAIFYSYSACNVAYTLRYMFPYAKSVAYTNILQHYVIIFIIIIVYSTCPVCVRLFVIFCHHAHLDPKI